jgi:hypothetical protein
MEPGSDHGPEPSLPGEPGAPDRAELDLFTLTAAAPLTVEQIAERIGADRRALTILLDALAAMGLLIKQNGAYRTEPSAPVTCADSPDRPDDHQLYRPVGAVGPADGQGRGGEPLVDAHSSARCTPSPGRCRRIVNWSIGGGAAALTGGGGPILAFGGSSRMRATIFDRPEVIGMARRVSAAGMAERVTLVAGDFESDPLPAGHDLAFVSAIIHQNSPAENTALFRKIFAALDPGGRVVVRDHVLSPDRTEPRAGALFAVNMLVGTEGGNSYTEAEIRTALTEAGFVGVAHPPR